MPHKGVERVGASVGIQQNRLRGKMGGGRINANSREQRKILNNDRHVDKGID